MGSWFVVRFRQDVGDERKQTYVRICSVNGPDKLPKAARRRKAEELMQQAGVNSVETFNAAHGETFRERADAFLREAATRKRDPVKRATLATWESCLAKYLNPAIGELQLAAIKNGALKQLVTSLHKSGLGARAIQLYTGFMKLVIASAVDPDTGDQLYPRVWNHEFADMPIVHHQKQPTFTEETMSSIAKEPRGQYQALFSLLGATGMRIGEALGLNISNINLETRVIKITQSAWRSDIQLPKTKAAVREIDITQEVADMLKQFIDKRSSGLLFQSRNGLPLSQSNISRRHLHPVLKKVGPVKTSFHAFRRFRTTWLRKHGTPEDLIKQWLGHAEESITDSYSKVKDDLQYRQKEAERIGIGFEISPIVRTVRTFHKVVAV
jgi:integrase